jgi:hypothetical protein
MMFGSYGSSQAAGALYKCVESHEDEIVTRLGLEPGRLRAHIMGLCITERDTFAGYVNEQRGQ